VPFWRGIEPERNAQVQFDIGRLVRVDFKIGGSYRHAANVAGCRLLSASQLSSTSDIRRCGSRRSFIHHTAVES